MESDTTPSYWPSNQLGLISLSALPKNIAWPIAKKIWPIAQTDPPSDRRSQENQWRRMRRIGYTAYGIGALK